MDQISNSTTLKLPDAAFIDCDGCIYTHSATCFPRMIDVAGEVVNHLTGMPKYRGSQMATLSFQYHKDGFLTFREDHGEDKYRAMHRQFDVAARNDTYGVMNPVIPHLVAKLSEQIPVYVVSHTTETALKTMLGRMGFDRDLIDNRAIGMDSFEETHGWLRKDRRGASILTAIAERDGLDLSKSMLFEDSQTNIDVSKCHGITMAFKTTPDNKGGDLAKGLHELVMAQAHRPLKRALV